jgi:ketosteroid isomerase-like protein
VFGKLMASLGDIGRKISHRIAQFVRFENGKVVEYVSIIDSFDAVE